MPPRPSNSRPPSPAKLDALLAALAHPARRQILLIIRLRGGAMTAGDIADRFRFAWPTVTRHLAVLHSAGLLTTRAAGRHRIYRVNDKPLALITDWLTLFAAHRPTKPPPWSKLSYATMRNAIASASS